MWPNCYFWAQFGCTAFFEFSCIRVCVSIILSTTCRRPNGLVDCIHWRVISNVRTTPSHSSISTLVSVVFWLERSASSIQRLVVLRCTMEGGIGGEGGPPLDPAFVARMQRQCGIPEGRLVDEVQEWISVLQNSSYFVSSVHESKRHPNLEI